MEVETGVGAGAGAGAGAGGLLLLGADLPTVVVVASWCSSVPFICAVEGVDVEEEEEEEDQG